MGDERIAVFEERELTNFVEPDPPTHYLGVELPRDDAASKITLEAVRAVRTQACPFCSNALKRLDHWQDDDLLLCAFCGYWVGIGTRVGGPAGGRVVRGAIDFLDLDAASLDQLLYNIRSLPKRLRTMDPFRAEKVMMELLAETLDCEVRAIGGRRDGGVDGYILAGDGTRSIVQVKWRQTGNKGETVSVVRELAGTMLVHGEPSALLVTTRDWMSKPSRDEISQINHRTVADVGKLQIDTVVYQDILDMLDLAWERRGGDFQSAIPWLREATDGGASFQTNRDWVFDFGPP